MMVRVDAVQARHLTGLDTKPWEARRYRLRQWFDVHFGWDWVRRCALDGFIEAIHATAPYR